MKTYMVSGKIELNFSVLIEAESEDNAEEIGRGMAEDGNGLGCPVSCAEVTDVDLHY